MFASALEIGGNKDVRSVTSFLSILLISFVAMAVQLYSDFQDLLIFFIIYSDSCKGVMV